MIDFTNAATTSPRPASIPRPNGSSPAVAPAESAPVARFRRRIFAVIDFLGAIASAPFAFLIALFGFEIGNRRGHDQPVCPICLVDVHDVGEICPKAQVADCSTCGRTVDLDRFLNCTEAGDRWRYHVISNVRPKPQRLLRSVPNAG